MTKMEIAREFAAMIEDLEALAEEAISTADTSTMLSSTAYNDGKAVAFTAAIELLKRQANSLLN